MPGMEPHFLSSEEVHWIVQGEDPVLGCVGVESPSPLRPGESGQYDIMKTSWLHRYNGFWLPCGKCGMFRVLALVFTN